MRIFVTGGTGMIGTRLIRHLREQGYDVVVLTRRPAEAKKRLEGGCTVVEGDLTRADGWIEAVAVFTGRLLLFQQLHDLIQPRFNLGQPFFAHANPAPGVVVYLSTSIERQSGFCDQLSQRI
jgi:uncharacterized protein YbjT (DUF2867 family)